MYSYKSLYSVRTFCAFALASVSALHAQTLVFDRDSGSSNWITPANWSGNVLPGSMHTADLDGNVVTLAGTASIAGLRNNAANGTLTVDTGGSLTVGSGYVNIGSQGLSLIVNAGSVTTDRIFTNPSLSGSAGQVVLNGGILNATNRISLTSTNTSNSRINRFTISGGSLMIGPSGFTLYGAGADDRPFLEVIGSDGAFTSANSRCNVTLANTGSSAPASSAASVEFSLTDASVTTIYATNLVLANNPLEIDFTNVSLPPGTYSYTLFDYSGTLTGTFATPTYTGLDDRTASFDHVSADKRFVVMLTVPVPAPVNNDPVFVADFGLPPQNAQGWTILTPSSDSRIVYVDPVSGNDSNGLYYAPGASVIGSNPQSPSGAIRAYRTIAAASAQLRNDKPDWILLRADRVFNESLQIKRGRSAAERAVAAVYGTGARPELRTGPNKGIAGEHLVNAIVQGIRFWAHTRDSDGPHFTGYAGTYGFYVSSTVAGDPDSSRDALIEDCVFRSYANNLLTTVGGAPHQPLVRIVVRRSIISGNYSAIDHSQGLNFYSVNTNSTLPEVLLQENFFDHNGWRIQQIGGGSEKEQGQATMFNHNTYFISPKKVLFEKNIFARASSIGTKFTAEDGPGSARSVVLANNLFIEGEIGISIGGNDKDQHRFRDIVIRDNVFSDIGRTRPSNRELAFYLDVQDWDNGVISDNLLIHQRHAATTNAWAMQIRTSDIGATRDVVISGNTVANFRASTNNPGAVVRFDSPSLTTNVLFEDNTIVSSSASRLGRFAGGGYSFAGTNRYYSTAATNSRFVVNGSSASLAAWINATGDTGAVWGNPGFPAPTRDVESYMETLGQPATFQSFLGALHNRERGTWNSALTAPVINNWLRAGFGMPAVNN